MIETMNLYGRTVVAPTDSGGNGLCELPYVYFQKFIRAWWAGNVAEKPLWVDKDDHEPFIDWWFEQDNDTLWQVVLKYFDWKCMLSPEAETTNTVHEIITRGAASNERALVPWNMIPVTVLMHKRLHELGWKIHRFDPLDSSGGVVLFGWADQGGWHRVDNDDIYFYKRPSFEAANNANHRRDLVLEWSRNRVKEDWKIAAVLSVMREERDFKALGETSHKSMLSGMQSNIPANAETGQEEDRRFYTNTGECNTLEKALEKAIELNCVKDAMRLEPWKAVKIMKRVEDRDEMIAFMRQVAYLSLMDFKKLWKERYVEESEKPEIVRDAIEAVCKCGEAHLKVHRHVLDGVDDQFGMDAQYTVDNGEPVHTSRAVEIVVDKTGDINEQNEEEIAL